MLEATNGIKEHQNFGEYYEIVGRTFYYFYNDEPAYVVGDFDAWDDEAALDAAVRDYFIENGADEVDKIIEVLEELRKTEKVKRITKIVIGSHLYNFEDVILHLGI